MRLVNEHESGNGTAIFTRDGDCGLEQLQTDLDEWHRLLGATFIIVLPEQPLVVQLLETLNCQCLTVLYVELHV